MRTFYLFVALLSSAVVFAQDSGENVFATDILHEVNFEFSGGDFLTILENNFQPFSPFDPGPYTMANVVIDGERADSVGVRLKGFTSYQGPGAKNPLKVDFNRYVPGRRLDGLRKINLNNATADPGMQRDVICYQMLNDAGVPAPRTAFARVSINGVYWGLYQIIEQVDKEFLQRNYNNADGNLFKNKDWNNFEYFGDEAADYSQVYQLKTNQDDPDWSGLANLMRTVQETPVQDFPFEISQVFNVDRYLRTLAVDVATNNWDSNLQHGRNWYLYEDTETGIFHWIPWDYNLALDGQLGGGGFGDFCFAVPDFLHATDSTTTVTFVETANASDYDTLTFFWDFGDGTISTERNPVHTFPAVGAYEVCMTVGTGIVGCGGTICYEVDLTENTYDCQAITDGNLPTDDPRVWLRMLLWEPGCCNNWNEECTTLLESLEDWFGQEDEGGSSAGSGFDIDQRGNGRVLIDRLLAVPHYYETYRRHFCTLMEQNFTPARYHALVDQNRELIRDAAENDVNFLYNFNDFLYDTGNSGIKKLLTDRAAYLNNELAESGGCPEPRAIAAMDIVINEFMAINDSLGQQRDDAGETDDWIEIYNNSGEAMDLSDVYLSDNPENKFKWQFPAGTGLAPDEYLIVWCDEDGGQTGLHASFKLNGSGESVFLSNADGSTIDEVTFGEQENNVSRSRVPNGTGNFTAQHTTFKYSNDTPSSTPDLGRDVLITLFPNPVNDRLNLRVTGTTQRYTADVVSALGQVIRRDQPVNDAFDVSGLSAGFYLLVVRDDAGRSRTLRFVKE